MSLLVRLQEEKNELVRKVEEMANNGGWEDGWWWVSGWIVGGRVDGGWEGGWWWVVMSEW